MEEIPYHYKHHIIFNKKERYTKEGKKIPRIYVDGCYDMFHWGHANVIRQACSTFNYECCLVLGIVDNQIIEKHKGPTVMTEEERNEAVYSCQWVDEVVDGIPFWNTELFLINELEIDYVIHGDDISLNTQTGQNSYQAIIDAGLMKIVPRTEGVSTTDLIYRMMTPTSFEHHSGFKHCNLSIDKVMLFSQQKRSLSSLQSTEKIVYIDGSFDLLHEGHYKLFKKVKDMYPNCYLLIGVYDDTTVNQYKGKNYPILNIGERVMGLLACRYVDNIIIGAPKGITSEMIEKLKIDYIVHGICPNGIDKQYYKDAIDCNKYIEIDSESSLTSDIIIDRVIAQQSDFEIRNSKKKR